MKKGLLLLSVLCFSMTSLAESYKILQMNTPSIMIGGKLCKNGAVFYDTDSIRWTNEKQVIKAMNLNTKQIKLFVAKTFAKSDAISVKDYYLKNNHLSTRGGIVSFSDLTEELSDTLFLYDSMHIESPVKIDSLSSYLISYVQDGEKKWRTLMSTDEYFFFNRDLFGDNISDGEYTLTLYFRKKGMEDFVIRTNVIVVILPLDIEATD